MLEHIITSKAKRRLLKLFITNPDSDFYTREIAKLTGESINGVRRELSHLEKAGLVRSRRKGNLKYYSLVKEFPFYPELKKIIYTTVGLGDYLSVKFKEPQRIDFAFIYGSVASNRETARSDIDLFVVGEIDEPDLHALVSQIEADIRRSINYVLMSKAEFQKRMIEGEPFVKRVMGEDKIILKGNPDVYRKTG
jgi:predicted nucleotidyltransferase